MLFQKSYHVVPFLLGVTVSEVWMSSNKIFVYNIPYNLLSDMCWTSRETSIAGDVGFLFPILVLIPCIIYFSYEFNKYKKSIMISKRHPNLTLTMSIVNIIFILGDACYIYSLTHCNNHQLYADIGMSTLAATFWISVTLFELRVWLITFDNNYALAKQNSLWRFTINSKGIPFSKTKKKILNLNIKRNYNYNHKNHDNNSTNDDSEAQTQSQTQSKSKSRSKSKSLSKSPNNTQATTLQADGNSNSKQNVKYNPFSLSSKIETDPMWFVKNKSTLGNYSYLFRIAVVKPIIETSFGLTG